MPTYNSEQHLQAAIDSIINQTYPHWELLILDDGSQDGTQKIVEGYQDERVFFYPNESNLGLAENLNRAKPLVNGQYIARMDSDDISLPHRFEKQIHFLEQHPNIVMVGAALNLCSDDLKEVLEEVHYPLTAEQIRTFVLVRPPFTHATLMIRSDFYHQDIFHYHQKFSVSEDYDLWSRVCFSFETANLDEVLFYYRWHALNSSNKMHDKQVTQFREIRSNIVRHYCPEWSDSEVDDYLLFLVEKARKISYEQCDRSMNRIEELCQVVVQDKSVDLRYFRDFIFLDRVAPFLIQNPDLCSSFAGRVYHLCRLLRYPWLFSIKWYFRLLKAHLLSSNAIRGNSV